eukprot:TRINITY_DN32768_c0_g1_i1.p1 TRINITY_DN32768_c0_g1~~TRINITY_DN32768_c0_g1_i1.p1  ORF type:complete len:2619 (+),score=522.37 TRINITY_DN32768_c0_g1_i1:70-7926(+)
MGDFPRDLSVDVIGCVGGSIELLAAHAERVCAASKGGAFVVCSASGTIESASGQAIETAEQRCEIQGCVMTPCGRYLVLRDSLGRFRMLHTASLVEVWACDLPDTVVESSAGSSVARGGTHTEMNFVDDKDIDHIRLLALLPSGTLVCFSGFGPTGLAEMSARLSENSVESVAEARLTGICYFTGRLATTTLHFSICGSYVFSTTRDELLVHMLDGNSFRLQDAVALPGMDAELLEEDLLAAEEVQPSPPKRRRLLGADTAGATQAADELLYLAVWAASSSRGGAVGGLPLAGRAGGARPGIVGMVFQQPGALVLYDAAVLVEVQRWSHPMEERFLAAAQVALPQQAAAGRALGGITQPPPADASAAAAVAVFLASGTLLVLSVPACEVRYSASVVTGPPTKVLLAAPTSFSHGGSQGTRAASPLLAFVYTVSEGRETLAALRASGPQATHADAEAARDVGKQSAAALKQTLALHMDRAQQGKVRLDAATFLRLVGQLVHQSTGFVVSGVLRAYFADISETRAAIRGVLHHLDDATTAGSYDVARGRLLLTGALARLATFEHLSGMFSTAPTMARRRSGQEEEGGRAPPASTTTVLRDAMLGSGRPQASPCRSRHDLSESAHASGSGGSREAEQLAAMLAGLGKLSGITFCKVWQCFRRAQLPRLCQVWMAAGWLAETHVAFARHACSFHEDEVLNVVEALPEALDAEQAEALPVWLAKEVMPRLTACFSGRLARWLVSRAERLEQGAGSTGVDSALKLLAPCVAAGSSRFGTSCSLGQQADIARQSIWAGYSDIVEALSTCWAALLQAGSHSDGKIASRSKGGLLPAPPAGRIVAATTRQRDCALGQLLELFRQLLCCKYLRLEHALQISLEDYREVTCDDSDGRAGGKQLARMLLGRTGVDEQLREEVAAHVLPICAWCGIDAEDMLEDYALEMAQDLLLPKSQVLLRRAVTVAGCLQEVHRRARIAVTILQRWHLRQDCRRVPPELTPLLAEAASWPSDIKKHFEEEEMLIQRRELLVRYGLPIGDEIRDSCWSDRRLAGHLLTRVESQAESLKDALSLLKPEDSRGSDLRSEEAVFVRLTHIAAGIEDDAGSSSDDIDAAERTKALLLQVHEALECCDSAAGRNTAVRCCANYCCDLLGDWAGSIAQFTGMAEEENESASCGAELPAPAPEVTVWKAASKSLCAMAVQVLRQVVLEQLDRTQEGDAGRSAAGAACCDDLETTMLLDSLQKLLCLQQDFNVYLDPLVLLNTSASFAARRKVFYDFLAASCRRLAAGADGQLCEKAYVDVQGEGGAPKAEDAAYSSCRRVGELLSLSQADILAAVADEAVATGCIAMCNLALGDVLRRTEHEAVGLAKMVGGLLHRLGDGISAWLERAETLTASARLELQEKLARLEDIICDCLDRCDADELSPLLKLATTVQWARKALHSADVLPRGDQPRGGQGAGAQLALVEQTPVSSSARQNLKASRRLETQPAGRTLRATLFGYDHRDIKLPLDASVVAAALAARFSASGERDAAPASDKRAPGQELLKMLWSCQHTDLAIGMLVSSEAVDSSAWASLQRLAKERSAVLLRTREPDVQLAAACLATLDAAQAVDEVGLLLSATSISPSPTSSPVKTASSAGGASAPSMPQRKGIEPERLTWLLSFGTDMAAMVGDGATAGRLQVTATRTKLPRYLAIAGSAQRFAALSDGSCRTKKLVDKLVSTVGDDWPLVSALGSACCLQGSEVAHAWFERQLLLPVPQDRHTLEAVRGPFDESYRAQIVQAVQQLQNLDAYLLEQILPALSPYDYERIGFVVSLLHDPRASSWRQLLCTLDGHRRHNPVSEAERRDILSLVAALDAKFSCGRSRCEELLCMFEGLAARRLPWHAVAIGPEPLQTLQPELRTKGAIGQFLWLAERQGFTADDLRSCFVENVCSSEEDSADVEAQVHHTLMEMRDVGRAAALAAHLGGRLRLGRKKIALAKVQLDLAKNARPEASAAASGPFSGSFFSTALEATHGRPSPSLDALAAELAALESMWDLQQAGLEGFGEILQEHDIQVCLAALYYHAPALVAAKVASAASLHALFEALCARHSLASHKVRKSLVERWLIDPSQPAPPAPQAAASLILRYRQNCEEDRQKHNALKELDCALEPMRPSAGGADDAAMVDRIMLVLNAPEHRAERGDEPDPQPEEAVLRQKCVRLLKLIFRNGDRMPFDAKCRALVILFRIAPEDIIEQAYKNPVSELKELWRVYTYLDAFEHLGLPQDLKRFHECGKDVLARALWRSYSDDPRLLQVVISLCLDYRVVDGPLWESLLTAARRLDKPAFVWRVIVALHSSGLALELSGRRSLDDLIFQVLRQPAEKLEAWLLAQPSGDEEDVASHELCRLQGLPDLLRQSALADCADFASDVSRMILAAADDVPEERLRRLAAALAEPDDLAPEEASGLHALAALCLRIAVCDPSPLRVASWVHEEVVLKRPQLILPCLRRAGIGCGAAAAQRQLLDGVLRHGLAPQARHQVSATMFDKLIAHALFSKDFETLVCSMFSQNDLSDIAYIVECACRSQGLPEPRQLFGEARMTPSTVASVLGQTAPGTEGQRYLLEFFDRMRSGRTSVDPAALRDFLRSMNTPKA